MKLETFNWKKKHNLFAWSNIESFAREMERHEHEEFKRVGHNTGQLIQVFANANQAIAGLTVINFAGEDFVDPGYFAHPAANQIQILQNGRYRITTKVNCDSGHRSRVLIDGVEYPRGTAFDGS